MESSLLYCSLVFLVLALVAGGLGFSGVARASSGIAKVIFGIFAVLFVVSLIGNFLS